MIFGPVLRDHVDGSNDVVVQSLEVFSGDPVLQDRFAANLLNLVCVEEVTPDREPCHVSDTAVADIPVKRAVAFGSPTVGRAATSAGVDLSAAWA